MQDVANDLLDAPRTGGQYSLVRALFAAVLVAAIIVAAFSRTPGFENTGYAPGSLSFRDGGALGFLGGVPVLLLAVSVGVAHLLGVRARISGTLLALSYLAFASRSDAVWWTFGTAPLLFAAALLFVPESPYGSWPARGRLDPRGDWTFSPRARLAFRGALFLFLIATIDGRLRTLDWGHYGPLGALNENYDRSPLDWYGGAHARFSCDIRRAVCAATLVVDALFVVIGLFATRSWVRRALWIIAAAAHLVTVPYLGFSGMNGGFFLLFLATFEPAWLPGKSPAAVERVFYDGHCGLCHRAVRFVLSEDPLGERFRFSALQGDTAAKSLPRFGTLPDSIVILTEDGRALVRSTAVLHLMARLGGFWRVLAAVGRLIPRPLRDGAYDGVAKIRKRLFPKPTDLCPMMPPALRKRFDP